MLKQGDPRALRREAMGARIAGPPLAPQVIGHRRGELRSALVPGRVRRLPRLDPHRAIALGRVLARVHGRRLARSGGLPSWGSRVSSLTAYARRRGHDVVSRAPAGAMRAMAERAAAAAEAGAATAPGAPFAFLHGDLVEQNIIWPADAGDPVLIDWEFWRMGDPAEDIAYLTTVGDDLPGEVTGRVYQGYGADWDLMARVDLWRPLVLLDAALWYAEQGDAARVGPLVERADYFMS